jgi:hypothetical protein
MLFYFLHFLARIALALGMAFIVGKTVPSVTNRFFRFVFLFVMFLLFGLAINYVDMQLVGYHKMSLLANCIISLVIAGFWELFGSKSDTANLRR